MQLISEKSQNLIKEWLKKYPVTEQRSGVIFALSTVQADNGGYLTPSLIEAVADFLTMSPIAAYEVATFYSMFELKPVGRHKISVCTNIACLLCGCEPLVDHLKTRLKIGFNETTPDGCFTLKEVECLAACGGAPALLIDKTYYENMTVEKLDQVLADLQVETEC